MKKEQEKKPSSSSAESSYKSSNLPRTEINQASQRSFILNPKSYNLADIVVSLNGRDAGKRFVVIGTDKIYSLIADGKGRRYEKPKRKKNKHLKYESVADSYITEKLEKGEKITNNEIRRFLASYAEIVRKEDIVDNIDEGGM